MQMAKSTKYFELFLRRNPGTVRVSTENSKDKVILVRCAIFRPATAEFRIILLANILEYLSLDELHPNN